MKKNLQKGKTRRLFYFVQWKYLVDFYWEECFIIFVIRPDTPHVLRWGKNFQKGQTRLTFCFVQSKHFFENASYYVIHVSVMKKKKIKKKKIKKKKHRIFPCVKRTYVLGTPNNNKKQKQIWNKRAWYLLFIMIWQ